MRSDEREGRRRADENKADCVTGSTDGPGMRVALLPGSANLDAQSFQKLCRLFTADQSEHIIVPGSRGLFRGLWIPFTRAHQRDLIRGDLFYRLAEVGFD